MWTADRGDGTYRNPVLFADYSDPDVLRTGGDFWMTASSFHCAPGLPILHSPDLVNWTLVNHAAPRLPSPRYDRPAHGCGIWAPSIRFHGGRYHIVFGDPDLGILACTAEDPRGPWTPLRLLRAARGWIDPCPFWDDDGSAWLVHAYAGSRAGIKDRLDVCRMDPAAARILDEGTTVFHAPGRHPTIEGPKLYKRDGWYYIFAPAGGVKDGWQTVLRSRGILGPYEDRIVMARGRTAVNGPHQGGWVETEGGEGWFLHFQDRGPYGRVVHLQPLRWADGWPVIGDDGEPVASARKPDVGRVHPVAVPATSDEFDGPALGLQWQWNANADPSWHSLEAGRGLRLRAVPAEAPVRLAAAANLLLQKLPAPAFRAATLLDLEAGADGDRAGLVVAGLDSACIGLERHGGGFRLSQGVEREDGALGEREGEGWPGPRAFLRVVVRDGALCRFQASPDGTAWRGFGPEFQAREGRWIGARVGLFCLHAGNAPGGGHADFRRFRVEDPDGGLETRFASPERREGEALRSAIEAVSANPVVEDLLRSVQGVLAVLDRERQILAVNDAMAWMLGVPDVRGSLGLRPGEALGCVHAGEMPGGCGTAGHCESCGAAIGIVACLASGRPEERTCAMEAEREGVRRDLFLRVRCSPVRLGREDFLLLFLQDISREQDLAVMERTFFHDVNGILMALEGHSAFLASSAEEGERAEDARTVSRLARRLSQEVRMYRTLSRSGTGEWQLDLEAVPVERLFREIRDAFEAGPLHAARTLEIEERVPGLAVRTDAVLALRVLSNMVTNALEATEEGGTVRLRAERAGSRVAFRVWNAAPIPPRVALRIFQRNFSTKAESGRGLGTFSMKLFGERLLGGAVRFDTGPEGTTFRFELDAAP